MEKYLAKKPVYISGPIEWDVGENWRISPKKTLIEEFNLDIFDPFEDPKQQFTPILKKAREEKKHELIVDIAKSFVRKDLAMVDRADMVIAYLPVGVQTTGTHHEIINSNNAKKPTLLVTNSDDISSLPIWYFGFIPTECMFKNWEDCFEYLRQINRGEHKSNRRLAFIYGLTEFGPPPAP